MKYLSVCSGIEAASVAWEKLGWKPVAFSEIEPFPSAVLNHHWPEVPNLGDMTKYESWKFKEAIDVLVGGTPCQAFSVAGLRKGLADPRGGLSLTFVNIADHFNPKWILWENVPGVLSSRDNGFGCFLGALAGEDGELKPPGEKWADAGCVYGPKRSIAWRCLDAQYFGVAQRRKRCFLVACPRDQGDPAKVLFEWEGLRRDTAPSREARERTTTYAETSTGGSEAVGAFRMQAFGEYSDDGSASTMKSRDYKDATDLVATKKSHWDGSGVHPTLSQALGSSGGIGYSNQEIFSQGGSGLVQAIPIHDQATRNAGKRGDKQDGKGNGLGIGKPGDPCPTLTKGDKHAVLYENHPNDSRVTGPLDVAPSCVSRYGTGGGNVPLVQEPVAVDTYNHALQKVAIPIRSTASDICHTGGVINPEDRMAVRRLTPKECERLQGFPDEHTLIPWRGKPADQCPDGPRYKALGNSMAVPCMEWIGNKIKEVSVCG